MGPMRRQGADMTRILVIGANGQLARNTTPFLLERPEVELTLYLRRSSRLKNPDPERVRIIEGDATDLAALTDAMADVDVVYANLAGDMRRQAKCIVQAMKAGGIRRLIFISSMGIYDEVPGQRYDRILDPYRDSARVVEESDLDYTVVRPGWFRRGRSVPVALTQKGESFVGHDVTLDSLSELLAQIATTPGLHVRQSIGVSDA